MNAIERQLQQLLNKLQVWSDGNGFKFSNTKTNVMRFCQLRKNPAKSRLTLDGSVIGSSFQPKTYLIIIFIN